MLSTYLSSCESSESIQQSVLPFLNGASQGQVRSETVCHGRKQHFPAFPDRPRSVGQNCSSLLPVSPPLGSQPPRLLGETPCYSSTPSPTLLAPKPTPGGLGLTLEYVSEAHNASLNVRHSKPSLAHTSPWSSISHSFTGQFLCHSVTCPGSLADLRQQTLFLSLFSLHLSYSVLRTAKSQLWDGALVWELERNSPQPWALPLSDLLVTLLSSLLFLALPLVSLRSQI